MIQFKFEKPLRAYGAPVLIFVGGMFFYGLLLRGSPIDPGVRDLDGVKSNEPIATSAPAKSSEMAPISAPQTSTAAEMDSSDPNIINSAKVLLRMERRWPGTLLWAIQNIGPARTLFEFNRNDPCPRMTRLGERTVCTFDRPLFIDKMGADVELPPVRSTKTKP